MKNKILVSLLLAIALSACYSQGLISFSYNGKIGYLNETLNVILSPQYDSGSNFSDGYAVVELDEKSYVIDVHGNILYSTNSNNMHYLGDSLFTMQGNHFSNFDGLYQIVNIDSKRIIAERLAEVDWERARDSSAISVLYYDSDIGIYYINSEGEPLFENTPIYGGYSFQEGYAVVMVDDWLSAIMDNNGNLVAQDFMRLGRFFSEGLCPAMTKEGKTGYVNTNGQFVFEIPLDTSDLNMRKSTPFENGRAIINCLEDEDYWIVIDNNGNYQSSEIRADDCYGFNEGMALLHKYSYTNDEHTYGYVNSQGEIIYDYQFSKADDFYNGYARVIIQGRDAIIDKVGNIYYSSDLMKNNPNP